MGLVVNHKLDHFNSSMFIEDLVNIPPLPPPQKKKFEHVIGTREKEMDLLLVSGLRLLTAHVTNTCYAL